MFRGVSGVIGSGTPLRIGVRPHDVIITPAFRLWSVPPSTDTTPIIPDNCQGLKSLNKVNSPRSPISIGVRGFGSVLLSSPPMLSTSRPQGQHVTGAMSNQEEAE